MASALLAPAAHALIGDVNCDGQVTKADADAIANFLVDISTYVPCPANADINNDGVINAVDALLILQFVDGVRPNLGGAAPQILGVIPLNGTQGVPASQVINVFFSNPISSNSVNTNTISLSTAANGQLVPVNYSFSPNGQIVSLTPQSALSSSTTYQLYVSTGLADRAGDLVPASLTSQFTTAGVGSLVILGGTNQTALVNSVLPSSIVVQAVNSGGQPMPTIPISFQVNMGNGYLIPSNLRNYTVTADTQGIAAVQWMLGGQVSTQTVIVSGAGLSNSIVFSALATASTPVNLRTVSGNNQIVATGSKAQMPLVVIVTDVGGNAVKGTTVTFNITEGQGNFAGLTSTSSVSNSSGAASACFTMGPSSGTALVQANFSGMVGLGPVFSFRGLIPQASTNTTVTGTVIDAQTTQPLGHIYTYLADNPSVWAWTDQTGFFSLPASSGPHVVEVNGFQSGVINGQMYPVVAVPINAVQGQQNDLGMPAILPELDQQSYIDVSSVQGGTLTLRSTPTWQLYVAPGSAHFQNGTTTGRIYVASVPPDKIPMPFSEGRTSRFVDTIQPLNVVFNPPAQVNFPNADNLPAGTITDIFTLDYTSGVFLKTGQAKVSEDGTIVTSLPGLGITEGGWHAVPPPPPCKPVPLGGSAPLYCTISYAGLYVTPDPNTPLIPPDNYGYNFNVCVPNGTAAPSAKCCGAPTISPITLSAVSPNYLIQIPNPIVTGTTITPLSTNGTTQGNTIIATASAQDQDGNDISGSIQWSGSVTGTGPQIVVNTGINMNFLAAGARIQGPPTIQESYGFVSGISPPKGGPVVTRENDTETQATFTLILTDSNKNDLMTPMTITASVSTVCDGATQSASQSTTLNVYPNITPSWTFSITPNKFGTLVSAEPGTGSGNPFIESNFQTTAEGLVEGVDILSHFSVTAVTTPSPGNTITATLNGNIIANPLDENPGEDGKPYEPLEPVGGEGGGAF